MTLTSGFGVNLRITEAGLLQLSLCTDIQQSCKDTSIIDEADAPFSFVTASTDLTMMQLEE